MAALSAVSITRRKPVGNLFFVCGEAVVTTSGGHIPAKVLGLSKIIGVTSVGCAENVTNGYHAVENSNDGTAESSKGDLWLDSNSGGGVRLFFSALGRP